MGLGGMLAVRAQCDSLDARKCVVRSTMIGGGRSNVFETYLSPLEYKGGELRFVFETMRRTKLLGGKVSSQNMIQAYGAYTKNISETAHSYAGMVDWTYALHYRLNVANGFKILIGPNVNAAAGVVYNTRNSNNPAQAKAYARIGASAMAIYKFHIRRYPLALRYQADLPLVGAMFSPEYGESYYEVFSVGNSKGTVRFASLHNNPSIRQMLTLDFPIHSTVMRAGYVCDIQQAKVNQLKSHSYSHDFMIGFVRNLYLLRGKNRIGMPEKVTPF